MRKSIHAPIRLLFFAALVMFLAGCTFARSSSSAAEDEPFFRPPTLAAGSGQSAATPQAAQPTPECTNNLSFVSDQTYPDGTQVQPGEAMDKRWEVQNSGTCNWSTDYTLQLVAGPEMGAATTQPLYPALSGAQVIIAIQFTAPSDAGTYSSAWQAYSPDGEPFGDPIYIQIQVTP